MTVHDYLTLLRRGWLVVACTTLLGVAMAAVATYTVTPTYSADSTVVLTASDDSGFYGPARESGFSVGWANTYAGLANLLD